MFIQLLVDNPKSWFIPYALKLKKILTQAKHKVIILHSHNEVKRGDILCLLSCEKIFTKLHLNKHNLIVHGSDLPKGKGLSPLTWQVLEGKSKIPVTLFEATKKVDSGDVYYQEYILLNGTELIDELRQLLGNNIIKLIQKFVKSYPNIKGIPQTGKSTYYKKRKPEDSKLDIHKSISKQFNLLRVVDNERYPAFFEHRGIKYKIKINKFEE
ncbi:MAG: formyltransferase family protein [Bacteroidales bacterium]|nr:formyltransferase family protein [Bacteroidales bacterium]